MSERDWRGAVNGILYGLIYRDLDDDAVASTAREMVETRSFRLPVDEYYSLIGEALRSDADLTGSIPTKHSNEDFRDFLRRLLARLDALRPWPDWPFAKLPISSWATLASARPIARIDTTKIKAQERLQELFDPVPGGVSGLEGLVLRLRSGEIVALLAPAERGASGVVLLRRDAGHPADAVAEFQCATGFRPDEITLLEATEPAP